MKDCEKRSHLQTIVGRRRCVRENSFRNQLEKLNLMMTTSIPIITCSRSSVDAIASQLASSTLREPHSGPIVESDHKRDKSDSNKIENATYTVNHDRGVPGFPDFPLIWCGEEGGRGRHDATPSSGTDIYNAKSRQGKLTKEDCPSTQSSSVLIVPVRIRRRKKFLLLKRQAVNTAGIHTTNKYLKQNVGGRQPKCTVTRAAAGMRTRKINALLSKTTQVALLKQMSSLNINKDSNSTVTRRITGGTYTSCAFKNQMMGKLKID